MTHKPLTVRFGRQRKASGAESTGFRLSRKPTDSIYMTSAEGIGQSARSVMETFPHHIRTHHYRAAH